MEQTPTQETIQTFESIEALMEAVAANKWDSSTKVRLNNILVKSTNAELETITFSDDEGASITGQNINELDRKYVFRGDVLSFLATYHPDEDNPSQARYGFLKILEIYEMKSE